MFVRLECFRRHRQRSGVVLYLALVDLMLTIDRIIYEDQPQRSMARWTVQGSM